MKGMDLSNVVEKRKETWNKKYGVDNVSKCPEVQKKRKETIEKNHDVKELYRKLAYKKETTGYEKIVDRVQETVIPLFKRENYHGCRIENKYPWRCVACGFEFIDYVDSGRTPQCKKCHPSPVSNGEIEIKEFITSLGISNIVTNTKEILKNLEYDLYLPDRKIAFEYNGIYWHSDKFKSPTYHVDKFIRSREAGINLIQIFEDEWLYKKNLVKNRIKSLLGVNSKIFARNCTLKEITNSVYRDFVIANHLQGYAPCSYRYGLFYCGVLVAVMSFSKSRYTKSGFELIRFCSTDTVVGGASKLFKHFIKTVQPDSVVSYANRCYSDGNLYLKLGFTNDTRNDRNTGYWYIKGDVRYHRSTFTKKRLISFGEDATLSEREIMKKNGYLKIYDCGNYRFIWRNT
jgi:predicted Zn-ribbon and HTH transcriptional regulator